MKKLMLIFVGLIILYVVFNLAIEGTRWDKPKVFYTEDRDATYQVVEDDKSGYYLLRGTNGYLHRGGVFYIPIATAPASLDRIVGRSIKITSHTDWAQASHMPCQKGRESWCAPTNHETPVAVYINKLTIVN